MLNTLGLSISRICKPTSFIKPFALNALHPAINFQQSRNAVANFRPKKMKFKKCHKGFFPVRTGGSLRGTTVIKGEYGLQVIEGGRLSDTQIDVARALAKRCLKGEKNVEVVLRCFPDRPYIVPFNSSVSKKAAETRMGKGKGSVEYFATWLAEGRVVLEIQGARPELAQRALIIAGNALPLRTRVIEKNENMLVAPRTLPFFIAKKLRDNEYEMARAKLHESPANVSNAQ
ncbi:mitochondrial ribosomal large subunit component [Globomyces sp. JEL0801]|nr:mitochondrial ribosomal large subunit component [Globomyces sp. JEL0801]